MPRYMQHPILLGFLLGLLLLPSVKGQEEDISEGIYYVAICSAEMYYPSTETVCMVLEGYIYALNVTRTVTLDVQGQIVVLMQGVPETGLSCVEFQVPPPGDSISVVAVIRFAIEGDVTFQESKNVLIRRVPDKVMVQTDKPSYRASETVKFRIVTLNVNFCCTKKKYYIVQLRDPQGNCIFQWLDVKAPMCIADLKYTLTNEPLLGAYTISVNNDATIQTFMVDEQVLPRFEVFIIKPDIIYGLDHTFVVKIRGLYTYGKGVRGIVKIDLCRKNDWFSREQNCITVFGKTDATGCFETEINGCDLNIDDPDSYLNIVITAYLTEDGTGIEISATREVPVSFVCVILSFEEMDSFYKTEHPYNITLVVKDRDGCPLQFVLVVVEVTFEHHLCIIDEITDDTGRAHFSLETSDWKGTVKIRGYPKNITTADEKMDGRITDVTHEVRPYYSEAASFLRLEPIYGIIPCGKVVHIRVKYNILACELRKHCRIVRFYYLIIGKNGIMIYGQITIIRDENDPLYGCITVPITFTSKFGCSPKMVGFILLKDGFMTADRLVFNVEKCFPNWASLKFSRDFALPKDRVVLNVCSSVGSVCAIRAVDKSVQINNEDKELTPEKVFGLFPDITRDGYPDVVSEDLFPFFNCWWPWFFPRSFIQNYVNDFVDIFGLFKDAGMKVLTNCRIVQPQKKIKRCFFPELFALAVEDMQMRETESSVPGMTDMVRKNFPDTWIWDLVVLSDSDKLSLEYAAPDTITQFNARVFCCGLLGFGLSSEVSLTVFKPFFVHLSLPRSIIQGEKLTLIATVFNYLAHCIKIHIILISSRNFTVEGCQQPCVNSSCICANETVTFTWNITATTTGPIEINVRVDAVPSHETCRGNIISVPAEGASDLLQRILLVKPRGIRKEVTETAYICVNATVPRIEKSVAVVLPKVWVENSQSAYMAVTGDILGSTLKNLANLIQMPSGCGEQNMITLGPIPFVLLYLDFSGQLTSAQRDTAIFYMQDGYARQLQYKRTDGSYSAFGMSDAEGSTWLTAFVLKCFCQARSYITIDDDNVIIPATEWLIQQQQPDGCFTEEGMVIHTNMKGGVNDDISLSAYIVCALLKCGFSVTDPIIVQALACLRNHAMTVTNPYTMALLLCCFADELPIKQMLLSRLFQVVVSSGGTLHWTYSLPGYQTEASVEMTAYVLKGLVTGAGVTASDMLTAFKIVSFLLTEQSPQGGYTSTQDTIVAIEALVKYMMVTSSPESSLAITTYNDRIIVVTFKVTRTNRLLLQTSSLPSIPGKFKVVVEGNGCVLLQFVTRYNLDPVKIPAAFTIEVDVSCDWNSVIFTIVLTIRYIGKRSVTNMVLIEMEMLSGFRILDQPDTELQQLDVLKKVTFKNDVYTCYLEELFTDEIYVITIHIQQENLVHNLKPANINVYDYYLPVENAAISYQACKR